MSFLIGLSLKDKLLGGIICCSGFFFSFIKPEKNHKELPILICHGTNNNTITMYFAKKSYSHLLDNSKGFNVTYLTYDFAHELTWAEYKDIREFIEKNSNDK